MRAALFALVALVVSACGAVAPAPPPRPPPPPPIPARATAPVVLRQLHISAGAARRTTFALVLADASATLVETEERADDVHALADVGTWTRQSTRTYRGSRRGAELELRTDDMQPLALHCESRALDVAAAGAVGVAGTCGGAAAWSPAATVRVDALACTAPGQADADVDDDDRLVFAPAPGIEWAEVDSPCLRISGLRLARP